ncbi:DUF1997 domain-containing protein [Skeletonema marinoi]|uniref:DUF1997 domain-containing protein n=1 Tax=Skeletonema marinoi TaxID=267567 RepID=A0AAD8XZD3_9STRA|nr:DUF1997 domain-containing protein [Skeletonema marinoi]
MMSGSSIIFLAAIAQLLIACDVDAFTNQSSSRRALLKTTALNARPRQRKPWSERERQTILSRNGEHFKFDRMRGDIEFGSSSRIQTILDGADENAVKRWLSDDKQIAMSIWDPKLIKEVEPKVYRLKCMTLMFVTIQLAPHVDVRMYEEGQGSMFKLESVAFDPNIQILPGIGVSADQLGILIDVVGELYPSRDGKGVDGKIGFVTKGELPPPMRLLPEQALKSSLSTINRTITNFAIDNFQRGARSKFQEFLLSERTAQ